MRRKGSISKRCMVCIMSAMMMMSSVAGTMIAPMGAYAVDYENIGQMTADENGKYNLALGDTLATNTGTIHENNGTIVENASGATVEDNNGRINNNSGTVTDNEEGTVINNMTGGSVSGGEITNNYGNADHANITNNYGNASDSSVTDNWKKGTVTGDSIVEKNHGGSVAENVIVTINILETPATDLSEGEEYLSSGSDDDSRNDPPLPQVEKTKEGYVADIVDKMNKQLTNNKNGTIVLDFGQKSNLTVDEIRTLIFYSPNFYPIECRFVINGTEYKLTIPPRAINAIDEDGNILLVQSIDENGEYLFDEDGKPVWDDQISKYQSCLDVLEKEIGQLAGPITIAQYFKNVGITCIRVEDQISESDGSGETVIAGGVSLIPLTGGATSGVAGVRNRNARIVENDYSQPRTAAINQTNAATAQANTVAATGNVVSISADPASIGDAAYTSKLVESITNAPFGGIVKLSVSDSAFLNDMIISSLETRNDVSLEMSTTVGGVSYVMNVPAGYNLRALLGADGKIDMQKLYEFFGTRR